MCMHLTESHVYAFTKINVYAFNRCMHLTESHVYAFHTIRRMYLTESHVCLHLRESHVHAFNRITPVCI